MERKTQTGWLSLLLVSLAGAAYLPTAIKTPPSATPSRTPAKLDATVPDAPPADALILLGQHFGLDLSEQGLRRRVRSAVSGLAPVPSGSPSCADLVSQASSASADQRSQCEHIDYLNVFLDLDIDPSVPDLASARTAIGNIFRCAYGRDKDVPPCSSATQPHDIETLRRFARTYLDDEAFRVANPPLPERRLAADFGKLNRQALAQTLVGHAARSTSTTVSFLVATVPDAIDSRAGWAFDSAIEAIRTAAERSGYVMDRFFIPDWSADRLTTPATGGHVHDEQPGLLLFRTPEGATPGHRLLAVLFVMETPTAGIAPVALDRALRLASWSPNGAPAELPILGPFYSGSTASLVRTLTRAKGYLPQRVRIMTGSATSSSNKDAIEGLNGGGATAQFTFNAATLADDRSVLRAILKSRWDVKRMAWLIESNTAYGQAQVGTSGVAQSSTASPLSDESDDDPVFRFPLHVSRLRDLAARSEQAEKTPVPVVPLILQEAFTPSDAIPAMTPELTAAGAEIMLRNIARGLLRRRIFIVGIVATDARDKLFLARELRQIHPGLTFVTTENNVLFTHPDYADAARGMLVASPFTLSSQAGAGEGQDRSQFASAASQGIYNAALILMNESDDSGRVLRRVDNQPISLIYPVAFAGSGQIDPNRSGQPPLWFSLVGREDTWPIFRDATPSAISYAHGVLDRDVQESAPGPGASPSGALLYGLLIAAALLHVFAYYTGRPHWMNRFVISRRIAFRMTSDNPEGGQRISFERVFDDSWWRVRALAKGCRDHIAYVVEDIRSSHRPSTPALLSPTRRTHSGERHRRQLAAFGALLVVMGLCLRLNYLSTPSPSRTWGLIAGVPASFLVGLVWVETVVVLIATLPLFAGRITRFWFSRACYSGIVLALVATVLWHWVKFVNGLGDASNVFLVPRYTRLSTGLSPVLPIVLIALAVYLWGCLGLAAPNVSMQTRFDDSLSTLNILIAKHRRERDDERHGILYGRLVGVALVIGLWAWIFYVSPIFTFEGRAFSQLYAAGALLVHALLLPALIGVWWHWQILEARLQWLTVAQRGFVESFRPPDESSGSKGKTAGPTVSEELPASLFRPSMLFTTPRLADVEILLLQYERAIASDPTVLRSVAIELDRREDTRDPELHKLIDNAQAMSSGWKDSSSQSGSLDPGWALVKHGARGRTPLEATRIVAEELGPPADQIVEQCDALLKQFDRTLLSPRALQALLDDDKAISRHMPTATSKTWETLTRLTKGVVRARFTPDEPVTTAALRAFVALHLFTSVRQSLWRVLRALAFVMVAIVLLVSSHLVYPVQPREILLTVAAFEVIVAMFLAVKALLAVERDPVLSRLTGTTEGRLTWNWALAARLIGWVVLPIGGIVASRYPDVGDVLLRLLAPFEQMLR